MAYLMAIGFALAAIRAIVDIIAGCAGNLRALELSRPLSANTPLGAADSWLPLPAGGAHDIMSNIY
jgi:hypothetical protein